MDRRDAMSLPGSASYFMQRGLSGSGGPSGLHPLPNQNLQFHSNIGSSTIGSALPVEQSSTFSLHDVNNLRVASALPPTDSVKRKRGRPRKYGPEGASLSAMTPSISSLPTIMTSSTLKRGRGRPLGSGKKQQLPSVGDWVSGSAGIDFTPHVVTIAVGEDITTKIMSLSQLGTRAVSVMSANGSVSTVTLRQPSTSGGTVTYEGRFEILCLSGSYLLTNNAGSRHRAGGLSVSLASPDGHVIGGGVIGVLIAATPIQVILGSFLSGNSKMENNKKKSPDGTMDSDLQTLDNPVSPISVQQHNQHLNSTSLLSVWPTPRSVDMRNAHHVDIDLMRG